MRVFSVRLNLSTMLAFVSSLCVAKRCTPCSFYYFCNDRVFHQLLPILGHKEISMITKTHIIKAVFTTTLLYQSENCTLTIKERQMLTTTEMRCLGNAAGKTRMDKIRNEEIRRRVNMQPAEQTSNTNKIRWWSHIKRMSPTAPQSKASNLYRGTTTEGKAKKPLGR